MKKASLLTLFLIVFIDLVGFGILLPNQQYYGQTFGITNLFALTLIGPCYSLFQFLAAPILGKWSDRVGRRPVLLLSQCGTLVGFLLLFAAHFITSINQPLAIFLLYFSRVLDGVSGGNISIASAYIADITTPENRAKGMGVIGAAFGLGFVFGPFIGGVVGKHLGLHFVPLTAALFSAAALVSTFTSLPESLPPEKRAEAKTKVPAATIFHALADRLFSMRHALARPVVGGLIAMAFVNGFAFAGMEQTFSLLIQERAKLSAQDASGSAGYLFGTIGIIIVIVQGGLVGRLAKRFGEAPFVIAGPLSIAAGLTLVGSAGNAAALPTWPTLITGSALLALGASLFNPAINALISRHAKGHEQGEVLGASQAMASLARAVGPLLAGFLFWAVSSGTPYYVSAGICVCVSLWALAIRPRLVPPAVIPSPETSTGFPVVPEVGPPQGNPGAP
jgi:DHA1 family tetracycline resistance protein-like MFS transporter